MHDIDQATVAVTWTGQLVENGPIRTIVTDKRGQYLLSVGETLQNAPQTPKLPRRRVQTAVSSQPSVTRIASEFDRLWAWAAAKPTITRRRIQT